MGDLVNLNEYRKQRARKDAARVAAENRVKHGRSRAERSRAGADSERTEAEFRGKRLDGTAGHEGDPGPDESKR